MWPQYSALSTKGDEASRHILLNYRGISLTPLVQVEYIGSADSVLGGVQAVAETVEYVTLAGDITADTEPGTAAESRVIGVLRDPAAPGDYLPYYTIRTSEDPIQAVRGHVLIPFGLFLSTV